MDHNGQEMKKKCITCGELKPFTDFYKAKDTGNGRQGECIICWATTGERNHKRVWNTKIGYLKMRYAGIKKREREGPLRYRCYFTFKEFCEAFEKHLKKYGMRSAWGPHHLTMTQVYQGRKGNKGKGKRSNPGNMSPDRLDSSKPYTLQNLIFIRSDENIRKKDTSYEDCLTHIKLHEERFIKMGSI
tara:strand:- start:77 stop:637 length:561 start_codon:yes stop_codon:yes gene_type:complete